MWAAEWVVGSTEAEDRTELAQHGVLPSLGGGEGQGLAGAAQLRLLAFPAASVSFISLDVIYTTNRHH